MTVPATCSLRAMLPFLLAVTLGSAMTLAETNSARTSGIAVAQQKDAPASSSTPRDQTAPKSTPRTDTRGVRPSQPQPAAPAAPQPDPAVPMGVPGARPKTPLGTPGGTSG